MDFLIYDNLKDAEDVIRKLDSALGYPDVATGTRTYTTPIPHDTDSGKYLVVISGVNAPKARKQFIETDLLKELSASEKVSKKTLQQLQTEKAFKEEKEPLKEKEKI